MTRRIVHPNCAPFVKMMDRNEERCILPNREWVVRKVGLAWSDFNCDVCNEYILIGERCIAESYGTKEDYYKPWEDQYIKEEV